MPTTDLITFDAVTHRYLHADGHVVPSVSSILRVAGIRAAPFVGGGSSEVGASDVTLSSGYLGNVARGLQRGREVHRLTRAIDETGDEGDALDDAFDPTDLNEGNVNYVAADRRFRDQSGYQATAWEAIVWNDEYGYAGRVDSVGWLGTQRILIDRKTDRALHRAVWLQLAFYRVAWNRCHPTEQIDRTYALVLKRDTTFELRPNPLEPADWPYCVAAIWMYRWHSIQL